MNLTITDGQATSLTVPTYLDVTGATITFEFSAYANFRELLLTKSGTGSGKKATIALDVADVSVLRDGYYRVKSVKEGSTRYVQDGEVDRRPAPVSGEQVVVSDKIRRIVALSQAQYDSLPTKDSTVLYAIVADA